MERAGRTAVRCDFRKRYGDEIADIVEWHSASSGPPANPASSHDVKATLQAIVARPDAVNLQRIDSLTRVLLMDPAWRRLRLRSLDEMTPEQLTECATYALDHFPSFRKPVVERAEVTMTLALLVAARAWHAARRNQLLRAALSSVFQVDYERATAIIKRAHREFHAET